MDRKRLKTLIIHCKLRAIRYRLRKVKAITRRYSAHMSLSHQEILDREYVLPELKLLQSFQVHRICSIDS